MKVTEPGIYAGIPNDVYHSDPTEKGSLSVSGAKKLLPPYTPEHYKHDRENPEHKDAFDFGSAAHRIVLEKTEDGIAEVKAENWMTKAAKEAKAEAHNAGKYPLLTKELAEVRAMARRIQEHPLAGPVFSVGDPEQSAFAVDEQTGVWKRGRFDWLPPIDSSRRLIIPDYKTARSAAPRPFARAVADYRYHMQAAWYSDLITEMGLHADVAFVFVVQEKTAPYAVNVFTLDADAIATGRDLNRKAIDRFAHCQQTGEWPGYAGVTEISLPTYATYEFEDILND